MATREDKSSAPPDAGTPQGARDDRPAMLGRRFRLTLALGMLTGLICALAVHELLIEVVYEGSNPWSRLLAGVGGLAVGGALTIFVYGAATDRTDTGPRRRGRAQVSEIGEEAAQQRRDRAEA